MSRARSYAWGCTRAGRWWTQCSRSDCDDYKSGLPTETACLAWAERHQQAHERRGS